MLSNERIQKLWQEHIEPWPNLEATLINPIIFARAIEAEGFRAGQEAMRERAAVVCSNQNPHPNAWSDEREFTEKIIALRCEREVRNLEIEEMK